MNHRFYMSDLLNSPMKNRLSSYLLFFDELPLDENKIKQIPLEYFLKVSSFSNDKSHYVQIAYAYFDQIKEEDIPYIWDKYYKNKKKHKRNLVGTGLGLSIVKNILELHKYEYGVKTKKDKGSNFYFIIPKEK